MTNNSKLGNKGRAYGFFNSNASSEQIMSEIGLIKADFERFNVPSKLELSLTEGPKTGMRDPELVTLCREAEELGVRYQLNAEYEGQSNEKTALELADLYNHLYAASLATPEVKIFYRDDIGYRELYPQS